MLREALGLSLLVALLRRGGLRRISQLEFSFWPLVLFAALLQGLLPFTGTNLGRATALVTLILSYLFILFALYENRDNFSLRLAALGVALNFVVILANGGMPVSPELLGEIHGEKSVSVLEEGARDFVHVPLTQRSRLQAFSDVIPLKPPYPLPNLISIGDVLLSLGVFLYLERASKYRGRRAKAKHGRARFEAADTRPAELLPSLTLPKRQ